MSHAKALDILARVTAHGGQLLPDGDRVRIKAPRRLPASLLVEIETHTAAIARVLREGTTRAQYVDADALASARRKRARARWPASGRGSARPTPPPAADSRAAVLAEALAMVRRGFPVQLYSHALGRAVVVVTDEAARQDVPAGEARVVYTLAELEAGALGELGALA